MALLLLLKWAMDERMRRRRWSLGLDVGDELRNSNGVRGFGKGSRMQRLRRRWWEVRMPSFGI